jgi:hypothetical protein
MLAEMGIALDLVAAIVGHEAGSRETRVLMRHYVHSDMLERKAQALQVWDERLRAVVAGSREGGAAAPARVINHGRQPCLTVTRSRCWTTHDRWLRGRTQDAPATQTRMSGRRPDPGLRQCLAGFTTVRLLGIREIATAQAPSSFRKAQAKALILLTNICV